MESQKLEAPKNNKQKKAPKTGCFFYEVILKLKSF
jgi:hypothetical protein